MYVLTRTKFHRHYVKNGTSRLYTWFFADDVKVHHENFINAVIYLNRDEIY